MMCARDISFRNMFLYDTLQMRRCFVCICHVQPPLSGSLAVPVSRQILSDFSYSYYTFFALICQRKSTSLPLLLCGFYWIFLCFLLVFICSFFSSLDISLFSAILQANGKFVLIMIFPADFHSGTKMSERMVFMYLSDMHTHSIASGHGTSCTISDMAKAASKKGLRLLGITDHGPATLAAGTPSYFRSLTFSPRKRFGSNCYTGRN